MIANLVPACDRCGHPCDTDKLAYDGLGHICPACRVVRKPRRIQLRRTAGWRKPPGAIVVARPSKWGNPFRVVPIGTRWTVVDDNDVDYREPILGWADKQSAVLKAVRLFLMDVKGELAPYPPLAEIRGHDLACWCPLDQPCHADVLLELCREARY